MSLQRSGGQATNCAANEVEVVVAEEVDGRGGKLEEIVGHHEARQIPSVPEPHGIHDAEHPYGVVMGW
jgi:hypothetical protein